jgi:hypothetical protein
MQCLDPTFELENAYKGTPDFPELPNQYLYVTAEVCEFDGESCTPEKVEEELKDASFEKRLDFFEYD